MTMTGMMMNDDDDDDDDDRDVHLCFCPNCHLDH